MAVNVSVFDRLSDDRVVEAVRLINAKGTEVTLLTLGATIQSFIYEGKDIVLEIEVDGAMQVKKKMRNAITVMLTPPDGETLERRLRSRGTETNEVILWRLARAKEEIALMPKYDYSVVNEDGKVKECADLIYSIISAEHAKTKRTKKIIKKFI